VKISYITTPKSQAVGPHLVSFPRLLIHILPATVHIGGRSSIRKLRTRHALVIGVTYQAMKFNLLCVFLSSGVCLIKSESGGNTAAVGGPNSNGSKDYGLFQVSVPHNGL